MRVSGLYRRSKFISGTLLILCGAVAPFFVSQTVFANGGYPYSLAADCSSRYGLYSWCMPGDDYLSPLGYAYRNCTDWVAWKVSSHILGRSPTGLGNGGLWDNNALARGFTAKSTPEPGDAAVWDATTSNRYGHVAFVESVNANGTVNISEYNYGSRGSWGQRYGVRANKYVDFDGVGRITYSSASIGSTNNNIAGLLRWSNTDLDNNLGSDLILTTSEPAGGSAAVAGLSTYQNYWVQPAWWKDMSVGWSGMTPLSGDVNGDRKADYMFMADSGNGVHLYVSLSNGVAFSSPGLWWNGIGYKYSDIKFMSGDVDGNQATDIIMLIKQPSGETRVEVMLSTWQGFLQPKIWWNGAGYGFDGIKPVVGDVRVTIDPVTKKPDMAEDLIIITNEGNYGSKGHVLVSSRSSFVGPQAWWNGAGYGFEGIKPVAGDMDGNGATDLVLVTNEPSGGSAAHVALSTWEGFLPLQTWWRDSGVGWNGITPMIGDVNGDKKYDYAFMADSGSGTHVYVAQSFGSGLGVPQLWWNGAGYGYKGIKPLLK